MPTLATSFLVRPEAALPLRLAVVVLAVAVVVVRRPARPMLRAATFAGIRVRSVRFGPHLTTLEVALLRVLTSVVRVGVVAPGIVVTVPVVVTLILAHLFYRDL